MAISQDSARAYLDNLLAALSQEYNDRSLKVFFSYAKWDMDMIKYFNSHCAKHTILIYLTRQGFLQHRHFYPQSARQIRRLFSQIPSESREGWIIYK